MDVAHQAFQENSTINDMIIFSGLGFLVVVFVMVFGFFFYDGAGHSDAARDTAIAYGMLLAGLASGLLGWYLQKSGTKTLMDKKTGREVTIRRSHSLFFIPMFYWGPILIVWGLYMLMSGPTKH